MPAYTSPGENKLATLNATLARIRAEHPAAPVAHRCLIAIMAWESGRHSLALELVRAAERAMAQEAA